eukprot:3573070-Alexandrium_andersonii.AAC.1
MLPAPLAERRNQHARLTLGRGGGRHDPRPPDYGSPCGERQHSTSFQAWAGWETNPLWRGLDTTTEQIPPHPHAMHAE